MTRRLLLACSAAIVSLAAAVQPVAAAAPRLQSSRPVVVLGATKSYNWSGYNQGSDSYNHKLFRSITGLWTVPTATPHKSGEAEYSSTWIGIGGGCVKADCSLTDPTLIQAGTTQNVDSSGQASYWAWWELIPAPSVKLDPVQYPVAAGDRIAVVIASSAPEVWTFVMRNLTKRWTWTLTVPYSSTMLTAEWVVETPVVIDDRLNVTVGPMPNLTPTRFDYAYTNGSSANLQPSEAMTLYDFNNQLLATPSTPDPDSDGFADCTYTASCAAPTGS